MIAAIKGPAIQWAELSPLAAPLGGGLVTLLVGLAPGRLVHRHLMPVLTLITLAAGIGFTIWQWQPGEGQTLVAGALTNDTLALGIAMIVFVTGIATVLLSWRSNVVDSAGGAEYYSLLLFSIAGMVMLASAENLVTLFIGLELLSIPLYVLCASRVREERSLEAGLKYLVIGSAGSATLLYGLAFVYGATGSTDFGKISEAVSSQIGIGDPLLLVGVAFVATGFAFKASVAPFHQWTPDVYQGAPTPVTAFMAVATKAAAFGIFLRFFFEPLGSAQANWAPALAALATITILIGNFGAIAQRSLKRLLAWSGVAQAGYLLAGVVVGNELGLRATVFYLAVYLLMNTAAFAVVIARERVDERGDDIDALEGLGRAAPTLAWPMTIAMLALAGFPATAGFIGKFYLIDATVQGNYAWLGVAIVVGSIISLVYYLRVIAVMWLGPVEVDLPSPTPRRAARVSGWSPEADARAQPEVVFVAVLAAAATIFFGIYPNPLFDAAREVGSSLAHLF
ncbi:MAG: NADH-quinone oxidoreductase subunit [Thermoleophilales bacterium]|jgi:NADH-quinone oxidoreductase subunit N|nr:NADH-quinone oxidoreductase subunit [Thermoleophilales bacterium]